MFMFVSNSMDILVYHSQSAISTCAVLPLLGVQDLTGKSPDKGDTGMTKRVNIYIGWEEAC